MEVELLRRTAFGWTALVAAYESSNPAVSEAARPKSELTSSKSAAVGVRGILETGKTIATLQVP